MLKILVKSSHLSTTVNTMLEKLLALRENNWNKETGGSQHRVIGSVVLCQESWIPVTLDLWYPLDEPLLMNFSLSDLMRDETMHELKNLGQGIIQYCISNGKPPAQLAGSTLFLIFSPWLSAPEDVILQDLNLVNFFEENLDKDQLTTVKYLTAKEKNNRDLETVKKVAWKEVIECQIPAAIMVRQGISLCATEEQVAKVFQTWVCCFKKGMYKNWKPILGTSKVSPNNLRLRFKEYMDLLYTEKKEKMLNIL